MVDQIIRVSSTNLEIQTEILQQSKEAPFFHFLCDDDVRYVCLEQTRKAESFLWLDGLHWISFGHFFG